MSGPTSGTALWQRVLSRKAAMMLVRNTVVSTGVFLISLGVLWALVEKAGMDEVIAAAIGFLAANTVHYALGRSWIFRGTDRHIATGYLYFLISGGMGLAITVALYWALLRFTAIDYIIARILVSIVAGLAMFLFNAIINFRRL
ncbi:GtrA family protein [uncultured Erythrobacter sp.]|uniref:GtrA family protein n=1 Tax=uncultured Erythrobacter sp. TaxID=263913 RepID=UPI0026078ADE|nr:GtrA family protein [uncultured Erythrobacter sp.]